MTCGPNVACGCVWVALWWDNNCFLKKLVYHSLKIRRFHKEICIFGFACNVRGSCSPGPVSTLPGELLAGEGRPLTPSPQRVGHSSLVSHQPSPLVLVYPACSKPPLGVWAAVQILSPFFVVSNVERSSGTMSSSHCQGI